ncbi:MAG: hypothetical protein SFW36_15400 [Leptolyngbyaceae cyanobacterium bins.59]|nr:hypothetical protein [Leptolyngbyaceae cyanobacterium bins.59]
MGNCQRVIRAIGAFLVLLLWGLPGMAGPLSDRLAAFPNWHEKPPVQPAQGDLFYPDWIAGDWSVTTTLTDLAAPLAPQIVSPGFEGNRQYLQQPVSFQVRFTSASKTPFIAQARRFGVPVTIQRKRLESENAQSREALIVADRAFNGLNLARAYLGDQAVLKVKVDPTNPNRQLTLLRNELRDDRQLESTVIARAVETPAADQFITTEVFQQIFRGGANPFFNEVETTTAYQHDPTSKTPITADQVTAIYLSPQDADFFKAGTTPVALYRYRLEFVPLPSN